MSYWYLASPYSKYPYGLRAAKVEACQAAGLLIQAGIPVFSPIAHSHDIAICAGIDPHDHAVWLPADRPMMDAARGVIVLKIDGWSRSYGVAHEIKKFAEAGKPVVYMDPGKVPDLLP